MPGKCVPACDVEHFMFGTAKALKAANPKLAVLMYLNSMMLFPFYSLAARYFSQPSLLLHDEAGRLVLLQNDAGLGNLTVPDWGQAAARELWWEELRNYTDTGLFDGAPPLPTHPYPEVQLMTTRRAWFFVRADTAEW